MLERAHLSMLYEIDRLGSLTAAADRLCVTQSAISHAVKKLEQQLGTAVWIKQGRKLRLTQAGQYLLALAHRLLPQFEHAEAVIRQIAEGQKGALRIGIECHPCNAWLASVVSPYLMRWPEIDIDVKQQFQFGGIGALFNFEIDLLVTPDPLEKKSLQFVPVFEYEQVLVVDSAHALAKREFVKPSDLADEILLSYPVETQRLDIFSRFLSPGGVLPRRHKTIEATDILFHLVAAGRGVCSSPRWLVEQYAKSLPLVPIRLGKKGIKKKIFLGFRKEDADRDYIRSFIDTARSRWSATPARPVLP